MAAKRAGPGPGAYMLPPTVGAKNHDFTRYKNPEYSMGLKGTTLTKANTPGPQYEVSSFTRYGKATPPAFSLASRPKELTIFKPPGPGTYSPEKAPRMKEPRPPAYSISSRHPDLKKSITPGPNQYPLPTALGPKVPDKHASSAYTMTGRHPIRDIDRSPGPAKYGGLDQNVNKNKPPAYSMSPRIPPISDKSPNPGPAGYLPKLPACYGKVPGFHFGARTINEPYITADDNVPCISR